jgi:hypothetical protein
VHFVILGVFFGLNFGPFFFLLLLLTMGLDLVLGLPIVYFVLSGVVFCLDFGPFFFLLLRLVMDLGPRLLDFSS